MFYSYCVKMGHLSSSCKIVGTGESQSCSYSCIQEGTSSIEITYLGNVGTSAREEYKTSLVSVEE